jgi:hypothetical protein
MQYVVARRDGLDRDVLMKLGCGKTQVNAPATRSTGLLDLNGDPILRVTESRQSLGFHMPSA